MTRSRRKNLGLAGLIALAMSLFLLAPGASAQDAVVAVSGAEERLVANDAASVGFSVEKVRSTARQALSVTSRRIRAVINRTRKVGDLGAGDIETGRIRIFQVRVRNQEGAVIRRDFGARQSVTVTVDKVKRTGAVVGAGVRAGATNVNGPRYFVEDADAAYEQALLVAFDVAKRKARALAERAGRRLGPVVSIEEGGGVFSFIRVASGGGGDQVSADAPPASAPVRPGKSRVRARVDVVFELL